MKKVYLAGKMWKSDKATANLWRHHAKTYFMIHGIDVLNPVEVESPNPETGLYDSENLTLEEIAQIGEDDFAMLEMCDLVFANITDGVLGTLIEIGYVLALGKPVVCYCEDGMIARHPMFQRSSIHNVFSTALDKAIDLIS